MGSHATGIMFTIGLTLGGVAMAIVTGSIAAGGIDAGTLYLTGIGLFILASMLLAVLALYRRFAAVESALADHKRHDLNALAEAAGLDDASPRYLRSVIR